MKWLKQSPNPEHLKALDKLGFKPKGLSYNSIYYRCSNCCATGMAHWLYCPYCGAENEDMYKELIRASAPTEAEIEKAGAGND